MAVIKFTIDYFEREGEDYELNRTGRSGVTLKLPYSLNLDEMTHNEVNNYRMNFRAALAAHLRLFEEKLISAGKIKREDAFPFIIGKDNSYEDLLGSEVVE